MTRILFIIILTSISVYCQCQNLFGDFTERDFLKRKSTELIGINTKIDTLSNTQKVDTLFIASYNPKNKIISILYPEFSRIPQYFLTDSFDNIYPVDEEGKEDTITYPHVKVKHFKNGAIKYNGEFWFYNKRKKLIRTITDTTDATIATFTQWNFYYSNDTLVKKVMRTFTNTEFRYGFKYDKNNPDQIEETTISNHKEVTIRKTVDRKSQELTTINILTDVQEKKIISKEYINNKLARIIDIEFK
jgi:hypothetical protein